MLPLDATLQFLGYALATIVYIVLAILLLTSFSGRLRGGLLAAAAVVTAAWAGLHSWGIASLKITPLQVLLLEMALDAAWILFLSSLLAGAIGSRGQLIARYGGIGLVLSLVGLGVYRELGGDAQAGGPGSGGVVILGSILTSLFVLVALEQLYRNARDGQRSGLKFLVLGVGGIFAYDLLLFSNAILVGQMSPGLWTARGAAVALCAPLIAVAASRSPTWSAGIFVSRHVVFYTATLFGAGLYLTAIGFLGYYLRQTGGEWGAFIQNVLVFAAVLALGVFLISDRVRRSLRVFITKHFFENKYDYREEWLRLIATLTADEEKLPLKKRGIKALAQILEVEAGVLWIRPPESDVYVCVAGWNVGAEAEPIGRDQPLLRFMDKTGWIIEAEDLRQNPARYEGIDFDAAIFGIDRAGLVIPLMHAGGMLGFVALPAGRHGGNLNFEDRDLLKTAGQQIASYLAQELATERLAEGRQFEAFNRLTAYLMHDLKNVIAQQSLIVDNAEKHKHKPEFVDDVVATIRGSVVRMRRIIEHLQQRSLDQTMTRVELGKLIMRAVGQSEDREPAPRARIGDEKLYVRADADRLQMALYHAIRNAQDATPADGKVEVVLSRTERGSKIEVVDTGSGMDARFVRERLFKPFDSTKGTQGMGIGAYQLRETIAALGGRIDIDSEPGEGTHLCIELPGVNDEEAPDISPEKL
ncbi:MAG: PEP-CTERM system histidine kinase PrsK [Woeseiaceae bacterium]|nr:PEP-CTERM system histidine kinase PrsK [Woeseiaceae bacterium]